MKSLNLTSVLLLFFSCSSLILSAQGLSTKDSIKAQKYHQEGLEWIDKKEYKKAIDSFKKELKHNPNSCKAYHIWGMACQLLGRQDNDTTRIKESIEKIRISTEMCPDKALYKQNLAIGLLNLANIRSDNKAILTESMQLLESIEEAAQIGQLITYNTLRGSILLKMSSDENKVAENAEEIICFLTKGYNLDNHIDAPYNIACVYALLGNKEKALAWLDEAILCGQIEKSTIDNDSDFDKIRGDEDFIAFLDHRYTVTISDLEDSEYIYPKLYSEKKPFVVVEQMPAYPGGEKAMSEFISANLNIPEDGVKYGINKRAIVRFVVSDLGDVEDIQIVRQIYNSNLLSKPYNEEIVRVLAMMPKWEPGKQNGKEVSVYFTLPIVFR